MSDWEAAFTVNTTLAELDSVINAYIERALDAVREQLAGKPMRPGLTEEVVERLRPLYEQQIRETFTRGWLQLQADAAEHEAVH